MILLTEWIRRPVLRQGVAGVVMVVEVPLESQGVYLGSVWVFGGVLGDLCNL
jgi:hypothetical protein